MSAFVQSFSYTVKWVPSKSNIADILTRQVDSTILPPLDLSFLKDFQKDLTILGWKESDEELIPAVPVYTSMAPNPPFWDTLSGIGAPIFFSGERFAGPPGSVPAEELAPIPFRSLILAQMTPLLPLTFLIPHYPLTKISGVKTWYSALLRIRHLCMHPFNPLYLPPCSISA